MLEFEDRPHELVRLIYASQAARGEISGDTVRTILAKSIQNNRLADITGFLVVGDDRFLQVLEGPAPNVDETFARLRRDDRHVNVTLIDRSPAQRRLFRSWNMAHRQIGPGDIGLLNQAGLHEFTPQMLDADRALTFLKGVGQAHLR
jgi:hypothetical protein